MQIFPNPGEEYFNLLHAPAQNLSEQPLIRKSVNSQTIFNDPYARYSVSVQSFRNNLHK